MLFSYGDVYCDLETMPDYLCIYYEFSINRFLKKIFAGMARIKPIKIDLKSSIAPPSGSNYAQPREQ